MTYKVEEDEKLLKKTNYIKRASSDGMPFTCQKCGKTTNPNVGQIIIQPKDKNYIQEFCLPCSNALESWYVTGSKANETSDWGYRT